MPRKFLIYVLMFAALASWGTVLLLNRYINTIRATHNLSVWDIVWLRFVPASVCFGLFLLRRRSEVAALLRSAFWPVFAVGCLTTTVYNYLLVTGEEQVPAAIASLLVGLGPSVTFALAVPFLGERVTFQKVGGMIISLLGLGYISFYGASAGSSETVAYSMWHLGVTIMATVAWSGSTIIGKKMLTRYSPLTVTAASVILGTLPVLPVPFAGGNLLRAAPNLPVEFWVVMAYLALVPTVFGFFVWYKALDELDATLVSSMVFLVPVFGVLFSCFWEPVGWSALFAGVVILAGVLITNSGTVKE